MIWEIGKMYYSTNNYNADYEFYITAETNEFYFFSFRKIGTTEFKASFKPKDKIHTKGIERYQAKYSKLGQALV